MKFTDMISFAQMECRPVRISLITCLALLACSLIGGCQSSPAWNVKDFGATGDGKSLDTAAVNQAIVAAAKAGGGVVHFTPGNYLCYSIHLQSNITLQLDRGDEPWWQQDQSSTANTICPSRISGRSTKISDTLIGTTA